MCIYGGGVDLGEKTPSGRDLDYSPPVPLDALVYFL